MKTSLAENFEVLFLNKAVCTQALNIVRWRHLRLNVDVIPSHLKHVTVTSHMHKIYIIRFAL